MTFEYIGRTGLTVVGPVTGRQYRFDRTGARVEVDSRDRPSIAVIPLLRQIGDSPPRLCASSVLSALSARRSALLRRLTIDPPHRE